MTKKNFWSRWWLEATSRSASAQSLEEERVNRLRPVRRCSSRCSTCACQQVPVRTRKENKNESYLRSLYPTPDRRLIRLQTALDEQLFDIAERERVAKIPANGTNNQLRCRLPPLEDRRSGCVLHGLFRLPATPAKVATHPGILFDENLRVTCDLFHRQA
jgi:hypothetical protein